MGLRPTQGDESGSCSATTVAGSAALPFVISTGGVMGLRPTQGDENRGHVRHPGSMGAPPSPLSPRTEEKWACGPPKAMKAGLVQQLLLLEAPPSPLSSRPEESWAFGPPKAMKAGLVQQLLLLEAPPSPLSSRPERS